MRRIHINLLSMLLSIHWIKQNYANCHSWMCWPINEIAIKFNCCVSINTILIGICCHYLGLTTLNTVPDILDFTSWLPSDAVPSLAINNCNPAAKTQRNNNTQKWFNDQQFGNLQIKFIEREASDSLSSSWSNLVFFSSSSISESGLTRVPSTRSDTVVPLSSKPFFRRSAAAFMRSSEPVSLASDPALGFLNKKKKTRKFDK